MNVSENHGKTPYKTSRNRKADQIGIIVSSCTIKHTLNQAGLYGQRLRKTLLLKKRHKKERLNFAKGYLEKSQSFRKFFLWTDKTKIDFSANAHLQYIYRQQNGAYMEKNTLPTVKDP